MPTDNYGNPVNVDNHSHGVWWVKREQKWGAKTRINGYAKSLGRFDTQLEAILAYDRAIAASKPGRYDDSRYLTPWGRKIAETRPGVTAEQMIAHDRSAAFDDLLKPEHTRRRTARYFWDWTEVAEGGEEELAVLREAIGAK